MEFVGISVKSVVVKLRDLLSEDLMLIRDVRGDIKWIRDQLSFGDDSSFLCSLDLFDRGSHEQSPEIRRWTRQMRDAAYDAGDFVDRIRLQHNRRPEPLDGGFFSVVRMALYMVSTLYLRRSLADEIHHIRNRVEDLVGEGRRNKYLVENHRLSGKRKGGASTSAPHVVQRTLAAPLPTGVEEPVGIEQAMEDVKVWFNKDPIQLRVFAIVGCGGLGKTTFAGALLRMYGEQFDSQAMVLASRDFNLGGFLRSLLKQIMPPLYYHELQLGGSDGWKDEELCEKVEEQLLEKRYIVVVDDVWIESSWKSIRKIFPENDKGSRIIVTTRIGSVAEAATADHQQGYVYPVRIDSVAEAATADHQQGCVYPTRIDSVSQAATADHQQGCVHLHPLNADFSHRLLQRILGDNHTCPSRADCPTSTILEKCDGLPLAIVAVTGLLVNRLASGSSLTTACGSLSSEVEKGAAHEENLSNILNLCYNDLPAELKTVFLFLRIFPVGSSISRKRLIRRWIAEGFITDKHGKTLEQVAEELFIGLIIRNLIQPVDISISGKVKTFQVHHVILENILSKSREENFISTVNSHSSGLELPQNKVRWLSIHRSSSNRLSIHRSSISRLYPRKNMKNMNLLHIRSLTAFGKIKHLKYFEILQVLDLEGCTDLGTEQLSVIYRMCLLKYLSLRGTYIKALPPRIYRLQCLEMLDIRETNVSRLPRNAGRLKQMVHLLGGDKGRRLALKFTRAMTKMSKLQTLSGIMVPRRSTSELEGMGNLTNLNKLSIYMKAHPEFLSSCSSLTSLSIGLDGFTGNIDDTLDGMPACFNNLHILKLSGKLCRVPRWIKHMQCLEELTLSLTSLKTDSLELLSNLPMLSFLSFSVRSGKEYPDLITILQENISKSGGEIYIPACGFHGLRSLRFAGFAIPLLSFLQGSMPALQMLELRFRMFEGVYGLQNLANLQKLHLGVSKQASELTVEKVHQIISSVKKHPRRPTVIRDEYHKY